jgi:preprotein translocase subunit SecA
VDLLEKGRELMSPGEPDRFVVPDLTAPALGAGRREDLTPPSVTHARRDLSRLRGKNERIHNIQALLKAYSLFEKDVEYVVQDGKVLIVDEFTGRLMPGRRYSEAFTRRSKPRKACTSKGETQTLATITLQNFFRMYDEAGRHDRHRRDRGAGVLGDLQARRRVIPTHKKCVRMDQEDVVYRTKREKFNAVIEEIVACHEKGQPVLVGTISVEVSELLSRMLKRRGIKHSVLQRQVSPAGGRDRRAGRPARRGDDRHQHGRPLAPTSSSARASPSSAGSTFLAPSGTSRGASTGSCAAAPAARAIPARRASRSRSKTT